MPQFYFNVFNGDVAELDQEGWHYLTSRQARIEGLRLAGSILGEHAEAFTVSTDWRMEITDDNGLILFRIDIDLMETSATLTTGPASKAHSLISPL